MQSIAREHLEKDGITPTFDFISNSIGEQDALISDDPLSNVSFMELADASIAIALQLSYRYGIRIGDPILIECGHQKAAEITAILGCARIGAPFVPVDDCLIPQNHIRLKNIIENCQPVAAIVYANSDDHPRVNTLNSLGIFKILLLEKDGSLVLQDSMVTDVRDDLPKPPKSQDTSCPPLYVLYTSGSTGIPKGCVGTHKGLINRLIWQIDTFPWDEEVGEVALRRTPLTFVDSLAEIFSALLCGIPLYIPNEQKISEEGIQSIVSSAANAGVSRLTVIPSQLHSLLNTYQDELATLWNTLKYITISGEKCSLSLVKKIAEYCPNCVLINLYGSTEVSGDISYAILHPSSNVLRGGGADISTLNSSYYDGYASIGNAITGNALFLIEAREDEKIFIINEPSRIGQLVVSGEHICDGYYKNKIETRKRFLPDLLGSGVYFLTGDLCKRKPDGSYTWVGRMDNQVKIRGQRIELEEAERLLTQALDDIPVCCVVIPSTTATTSNSDENILIAILEIPSSNTLLPIHEYKTILKSKVSAIYLPALIITMLNFPLTISGKIDRQKLKDLVENNLLTDELEGNDNALQKNTHDDSTNQQDKILLSTDEIELKIINIFQEILPFKINISSTSIFEELGGDSLLAIEALWKIRQSMHTSIPASFLKLPIRKIAENIVEFFNTSVVNNNNETDKEDGNVSITSTNNQVTTGKRALSPPTTSLSTMAPTIIEKKIKTQKATEYNNHGYSKICWRGRLRTGCACFLVNIPPIDKSHLSITSRWKCKLSKCIDASPVFVRLWTRTSTSTSEATESGIGEISESGIGGISGSGIGEMYEDVILIGSHGGDFSCIYADTGVTKWCTQLYTHIEGAAIISESKTVVYVPSFIGNDKDIQPSDISLFDTSTLMNRDNRGRVHCLTLDQGQIIWCTELPGEVKSTPLIVNEKYLWVSSYDSNLYILDTNSGRIKNNINCGAPMYGNLISSSDGSHIYGATIKGSVHAFDAHQVSIIWTVDVDSPVYSSVYLDEINNSLVFGAIDTHLYTIDNFQGSMMWKGKATKPIFTSPQYVEYNGVNGYVVGSHGGFIKLFEPDKGRIRWVTDLGAVIFASPFIYTNIVIAATTAGVIYILAVTSGAILTSVQLPAEIFSCPIMFEGNIYVGCRDDHIYSFKLNTNILKAT